MQNPPNLAVSLVLIVDQFGQDGLNTLMLSQIYIEALLDDEILADHLLRDRAGKCQF